jgi:ABC-2 type transport system ATP-binding protein
MTCPTCGFYGSVKFEPPGKRTESVINIQQLTKTFGRFTAVDHITLTIHAGEIYGLLGPNGSGKTTTIKMLCGLLRPTSGHASILGKPIHDKPVMQQTGYMPQGTALYLDNTVHENLAFFAGVYGLTKDRFQQQETQMLRFVNLEAWRDSLVSTLSGGMRHRLSLSCALLHEPHVVFLDEPTVGVDPELRVTFWEYFHSLSQKGVTVVITTHYMDEADRCTRVGLLRQGTLIAEGNPQDLKQQMGTTSLEDVYLRLAGRKAA